MDITRRIFVSGAMAMPFLGKIGTADATENSPALNPTFTVLSGLSELRLTEHALNRLREIGVAPYAVAPAETIAGPDGTSVVGVRLPAEHGRMSIGLGGRPVTALARALGGVGLRGDGASMEIVGIHGNAADGRVLAFLKVNNLWQGEFPVYQITLDEVRLVTEPGLPNNPTKITASAVPLRPAQEGLDAFAATFGSPVFTVDDVVANSRAEGLCWPLPPS
jgi:hypothetical protein